MMSIDDCEVGQVVVLVATPTFLREEQPSSYVGITVGDLAHILHVDYGDNTISVRWLTVDVENQEIYVDPTCFELDTFPADATRDALEEWLAS